MSSTPITPPSMATFEGPKTLKPGRAAIPPGDATYAMRIGATNALLQSAIDSAEAILADAQKQPVRLVATSNMALTGLTILDGVSFAADERILLTGQTAPAENGIWLAQVGAWTRPADANTGARVLGSTVRVLEGTLGAGTLWRLSTTGAITIGVTPLTWSNQVRAASFESTANGSAAAPAFRVDAIGGIHGDPTNGIVTSVGGVERIRALASGITEISRSGTNNVMLDLKNSSGTGGVVICSGSPEGVVTSSIGRVAYDVTNGRGYIKRTGSGNTGWAQQDRCESGFYTPTATAVSNIDAITPGTSMWARIGDFIVQAGRIDIDPTAAGAASLRISLAVASNFTVSGDAAGVIGGINLNAGGSRVDADATNDQLLITINTAGTVSNAHWYVCAYLVK